MTITDLKSKFLVEEFPWNPSKKRKKVGKIIDAEEQFLLFKKKAETTGRSVHKYLCPVIKKGSSFHVKGFGPAKDIKALEADVQEYIKALPYDSDYYCPRYRAGLTEELIIHDYFDSIGFKNPFHARSQEYYELVDKNIYGFKSSNISMSIWGLDSWAFYKDGKFDLPKEVSVVLHNEDGSWMEITAKREVEDIKKAIDSFLKPLYLTDSVRGVQRASELTNVGDIEMTLNKLLKNMELGTMDYKSTLKKQLEETLAKLG